MNHMLEKQPFLDFDGRKKMLSISDVKTNSDQKFDPTLKLSRKAVLALPPDSTRICMKTSKLDHISRSPSYSASTRVYTRGSKRLA